MITLKLYPAEFRVLIGYLRFNTQDQDQVPLVHQSLHRLVLLNYLQSWKVSRLLIWQGRRTDREFKLSMPLTVALALYQEMQSQLLTAHQQLLLAKLDQAVINYQSPTSQAHVIGELIGY
ncbi:hypothetical protein [Spirosoma sp.]|uniref:hypothetical protein n=1 Tax=Spirosoma sp. TaxID=1899569 RepID=UPI00262C7B4E|nr:hypothetical protein [Spirosoma sp.]MCX6216534.1 hypothetical protein [Spirosoma sp.]